MTMTATWKRMLVAVAILAATVQVASAQAQIAALPGRGPVLLGTTGACNNLSPGTPCTQTSTLVQIDANTGALIRTIGPVGFTVNGIAWDQRTGKLYGSTAIGDVAFHGLITIDTFTGEGTPVNPAATNFGLTGNPSPVHSITINPFGDMVAWYDEVPAPGVTDTFVRINKATGIATEFPETGIDSSQNGLSFQSVGALSLLWNIDGPKNVNGIVTQNAYLLNPINGAKLLARPISPPIMAALGDFSPRNLLYYGLKFTAFDPTAPTLLVVIDPIKGTSSVVGPTVPNLHALGFVR